MPIYDFRCRECGKVSEIFLRGAEGQAEHYDSEVLSGFADALSQAVAVKVR